MRISNRVTVLRSGKVVAHLQTSQTNKQELARLMVGKEVLFGTKKERVEKGGIVLEIKNLSALNDMGLLALKSVSLFVYEGEIFGVAGVAGNGQKELIEVITGLRKAKDGEVIICGKRMTNHSPREISQLGVAHIPEERIKFGLVPGMNVAENVILTNYSNPPISKGIFLDQNFIQTYSQEVIREFHIMTKGIDVPVDSLSGGNRQRLILGREMSKDPKLLIVANPTAGLDVGETERIRQLLNQKKEGRAILLVSEDLEEIFELSDKIAVMFEGEIVAHKKIDETNLEEIGFLMGGGGEK